MELSGDGAGAQKNDKDGTPSWAWTHDVKDQDNKILKTGGQDVLETLSFSVTGTFKEVTYQIKSGNLTDKKIDGVVSNEGQFEDIIGTTADIVAGDLEVALTKKKIDGFGAGAKIIVQMVITNHSYKLQAKDSSPGPKLEGSFDRVVTYTVEKQQNFDYKIIKVEGKITKGNK